MVSQNSLMIRARTQCLPTQAVIHIAKTGKKNYYAVKAGYTPGIYRTWAECAEQITGYSGAIYKGFSTLDEAQSFMDTENKDARRKTDARNESTSDKTPRHNPQKSADATHDSSPISTPYAFIDGSYNSETGIYGFGGFLVNGQDKYPLQGSGSDTEHMRNVSGEIHGAMLAIKRARELGITRITLFYDYTGIKEWVTGAWVAKKPATQTYRDFMRSCNVDITFEKVAAHTGIEGNEAADQMAKQACGLL